MQLSLISVLNFSNQYTDLVLIKEKFQRCLDPT